MNAAGTTKQRVLSAFLFVCQCAGNVAGPQVCEYFNLVVRVALTETRPRPRKAVLFYRNLHRYRMLDRAGDHVLRDGRLPQASQQAAGRPA